MRKWNMLARRHVFVGHRRAVSNNDKCKWEETEDGPFINGDSAGVVRWVGNKEYLGIVEQCYIPGGGGLSSFVMKINRDVPWYRGTGRPPANRLDLWSTAVHEFGHAAGWVGHFKKNATACNGSMRHHTMCKGETMEFGWDRARTLEKHDRHTFKRVYPAR